MKHRIPRLSVLDWTTFSGAALSAMPCLMTRKETHFTQSGRASILLALEMLGVGPGDKVLVPTYHCPTMIAPIVSCGAQPVFYPLNADGSPRLEWIQHEDSQGVRAILVAHFFGLPQPLASIREWCNLQGVRLLEDCAHALFGSSDDRAIGSWGDLAIASLTKFLPVPEGGCLLNNTVPVPVPRLHRPHAIGQLKAVFDIFHASVNHGRLKGLGGLVQSLSRFLGMFKTQMALPRPPADSSQTTGFSIDIVQSHRALTYASRWVARHAPRARIAARRREHYSFFARTLCGVAGLQPLRPMLPEDCAPYVFPLWVDQPDPGYAELRRLDFPVSRWDVLWPTVAIIAEDSGIKWSHHVLQLACHQDLKPDELQQMVDTLKRIYCPPIKESASPPRSATDSAEFRDKAHTEHRRASMPPSENT